MTSVPGIDHPEEQTEAHVALTGRGISVSSRVESVHGDGIDVRPSAGEFIDQMVVRVGDAAELFWTTRDGHRVLPTEVTDVHGGAVVRWRLQATGPAEHGQRRTAVRARVAVPVEATCAAITLSGRTVDLSEAGLRALFDGYGVPPESGNALDLVIRLEEGAIATRAEVVRNHVRGAQWLLSIHFSGMEERDQDRIRRRVFQALREERARQADAAPRP